MVQQAVTPWVFYLGDDEATAFFYPWRISHASELEVYLAGVHSTAYSVTGVDEATGGNVVFFNPPPVGQVVLVRRATPQTQLYDPVINDPFTPEALEAALDKLTREVQDLNEQLSRVPMLAFMTTNSLRYLVFPAPGAGKVLGWSADGTELTLYPSAVTQVIVDPSSGEAHGQLTVEVPTVAGASFLTASAFIPPGIEVAGIGYRVVEGFSTELSLASIGLGGLGVVTRWGTGLGLVVDDVNNAGNWVGGRVHTTVAGDVVLIAEPPGSRFGQVGLVRLTCFYTLWIPQ